MINPNAPGAKELAQRVIYIMWNTWKEKCRRVYENKGISADQLQALIRHDVEQWNVSHRCLASGAFAPGEL
jgi:hypothetical protein